MKQPYIKYIFALLLFGSNGIIAKQISLSSVEIVFYRTLIGSFLLILFFLIGREKLTFWEKKKEFLALGMSGMAMGASWIFLYEAYEQIGVSIASLCYYCGPIIVMVLSPILFHERLTKGKIVSFMAVLSGIAMVNGQFLTTGSNIQGLVCGIISAVMYALMVILNKKAGRITGLENPLLQLVFSFLTVAGFASFHHGLLIPSGNDLMPIFILGVFNTGIGCYFYFTSINRLPIQTVAVCGYLEPLSAVIFAVVLLKETMNFPQIIGALFIIGGAVFFNSIPNTKVQSRYFKFDTYNS